MFQQNFGPGLQKLSQPKCYPFSSSFFLQGKEKVKRYLQAVARRKQRKMDGATQIALPVLGIVAAAAVTFYVVSFSELREKSFKEFEDSEYENGGFDSSLSSRKRRARRKADKDAKTRP